MQLYYQTYGQGAPLIILHGLLGSHDNWLSISRRLGEKFQVFAVDQRNHGRSPHSAEMSYALMAQDLLEFLQANSLTEVLLLGHSMGGKTAMQFTLSFPQCVRRLVVVDIAPRQYPPEHLPLLNALSLVDPSRFQTRQLVEQALTPAVPDSSVRRFLLKNLSRDSMGNLYWRINLSALVHNYETLIEGLSAPVSVDLPVLFLAGENSDYIGPEDLPAIHRLFPHAALHRVPNAGHWVHIDAPDLVLKEVMAFFD